MGKNNISTEYAIVDIETTGSHARGCRITEIAVLIHDGSKVLERWTSLVNPLQCLSPAITALTGITNEMVADAPVFGSIAARVFELLEERVFVAHNVNFDYTFIRHQLEESGYRWSPRKLCTVRMARKLRPGLPSYSLGRLCDALSIPLTDRHRAGGDADATAVLFGLLMAWDKDGTIPKMLARSSTDQRLPPNLLREEFDSLPDVPGVYYFHDRSGKVIYVGKAVNLKKRVSSHFVGHSTSPQRQHFLREIHHISYEVCGTELMALLLECTEIKHLWPAYNRALKKFAPRFGLLTYQGQNGYDYLCISKLGKHQTCVQAYHKEYDGVRALQKLAQQFGIDPRFCHYGRSVVTAPLTAMSLPLPDVDLHNKSVAEALDGLRSECPSFYILDRGRREGEYSCIWVECGELYGMGYVDSLGQLSDPVDIRDSLLRIKGNHYMMHLVLDYAQRFVDKVHDCR